MNLKIAVQSSKRLKPQKVIKNNSHARVVGSIIKTATKRNAKFALLLSIIDISWYNSDAHRPDNLTSRIGLLSGLMA